MAPCSSHLTQHVVCSVHRDSQGVRPMSMQRGTYAGPGLAFVQALCGTAHGGQVVLSEPAWSTAQDQIPGLAQVWSDPRTAPVHVMTPSPSSEPVP